MIEENLPLIAAVDTDPHATWHISLALNMC